MKDIDVQSPDAVYLVGDQINRCPWSNEVMDLLDDLRWPAIAGNHEVVLGRLSDAGESGQFGDRNRFPDLWWTFERLGRRRLSAIRALPAERSIPAGYGGVIRVVHGVPGNPFRGIFVDTCISELSHVLSDVTEQAVVCGHTHQPLHRCVRGRLIVNGGGVGVSYNGDPRAHYLLLTWHAGHWTSFYRRVSYPVNLVRESFRSQGLEREYGPLAGIHLRTIETAQPWISDFGQWLGSQPQQLQDDLSHAVALYEQQHGPGKWFFSRH